MTWPKVVTKLAEIDLDDHAPKFKELGFDSMDAFDTSDKGALEKIADEVGLKPGHKAKFVKKFYEPIDVPPPAVAMAVAVPMPSVAVPIMPVEPPQQAKPIVPVAMPIVPVEPMSPAYTVVSLHKAEPSTRTGIALVRTANDKLKVESVGEGGVAHGLVAPGDVIIKINDMPAPKDHGEATGMLKALAGDIKLTLDKQRPLKKGDRVVILNGKFKGLLAKIRSIEGEGTIDLKFAAVKIVSTGDYEVVPLKDVWLADKEDGKGEINEDQSDWGGCFIAMCIIKILLRAFL